MTVKAKLRKDLSKADLLVSAAIHKVAISRIDLADQTFAVRDRADAACEPAAIQTERGVANFAGPHPVLLHAVGSRLVVINGFRRLRAANDAQIEFVQCRIVKVAADFDAMLLAARINLEHGLPLSLAEKRRCFQKETAARKQAGYRDCSDREWARAYHVSPTTIGHWLGKASTPPDRSLRSDETVQNGHCSASRGEDQPQSRTRSQGSATHETSPPPPSISPAEAVADLRAASMNIMDAESARFTSEQLGEIHRIGQELATFAAAKIDGKEDVA